MVDSIFLLGGEDKLVELKAQPYDSEDLLQKLLADYPHLMAGEQIDGASPRRWLLISREMGVPGEDAGNGRWSLNHLFLDQDGIPTLVEVKRSTDSRIRREVVGQMLDYAANAVAYWPVEEIRARFLARHPTEEDADRELLCFLAEDGEPEAIWNRVKTNLQAGRVRMIFVADAVPPELKRIVEFLNQQMDPAEVLALELRQYVGEGLKTLVPRVIGNTALAGAKKEIGATAKRQWDEEAFLQEVRSQRGAKVADTVVACSIGRDETAMQSSGAEAASGVPSQPGSGARKGRKTPCSTYGCKVRTYSSNCRSDTSRRTAPFPISRCGKNFWVA